ncbi:ATP synthase F0 subunit B [uncultured Desulfosarcina sp.]|uniref:ATP synthase F0 subunit B n=1 Tax=uncultured Desulfosarcina sp. TaxID=218289 RepID=UPI0029C8107E|nr:ATP synthase F0 subunit B [uncultured Desulfosarcina sp.]
MKATGSSGAAGVAILFIWLGLLFFPESALAGDPAWRPTYDIVLRWVNFVILVAVIVKYSRDPIKDFLKLQKQDVVSQIAALDSEKSRIIGEIKEVRKQGEVNRIRLQEMKDRLIAQGETRKQELVNQAKQQSAIMLEDTRRKLENRVVQAKAALKLELLDMAIEQAMIQLPGALTDGDNQRLLDDYMKSLDA